MGLFSRKKTDEPGAPAGATQDVDLSASNDAAAMAAPVETTASADALKEGQQQVNFYRQPEALSAKRHGGLGVLNTNRSFKFAQGVHLAPITMKEFSQAALHYPIIFAGEKKFPCAVMGLRAGSNVFINDEGAIDEEAYLPAYIRQYPFLLAKDPNNDRSILFIDRAADYIVETGGEPLFDGEEPAKLTKEALAFLTSLQTQWRETERFVETLQERSLLTIKELKLAQREASGQVSEAKPIIKYFAIDADKMKDLPAEAHHAMAREDYSIAVYAHQISLFNWSKVLSRSFRRQRAEAA